MDVLLPVLHVVFFAPLVVRLARRQHEHGFLREIRAGTRRPVLVFHAAGVLLLWTGLALALAEGRVTSRVTISVAIGAAAILIGGVLFASAYATFRWWRLLPEVEAGHRLCTSGPYRLVRHPMYVALDLLGIGTAVWARTGARSRRGDHDRRRGRPEGEDRGTEPARTLRRELPALHAERTPGDPGGVLRSRTDEEPEYYALNEKVWRVFPPFYDAITIRIRRLR